MLGKILLVFSPLAVVLGAFVFDFGETHVYNPRWPPHAKFHNGQTMSMTLCMLATTVYFTFRPTSGAAAARDSLFTALICASVYCVTGMSAILYPGAGGTDPEFGEGFPQFWVFLGLWLLAMLGWWLERRTLKVKSA